MNAKTPASMYRMRAVWWAIAGALFLGVAIFGMQGWDWRRVMCLVAGILDLALSFQQYRHAKSAAQ